MKIKWTLFRQTRKQDIIDTETTLLVDVGSDHRIVIPIHNNMLLISRKVNKEKAKIIILE